MYSATHLFAQVPFRQAVCDYPQYANKRKHADVQAHRPNRSLYLMLPYVHSQLSDYFVMDIHCHQYWQDGPTC